MSKAKRPSRRREMSPVHAHAAAVDIGATLNVAAVGPDRDPEPVRSFGTFTADLHRMADWFERCGVRTVAMESTGVYWIPAYEVLEQRGFAVVLVNARDAKHVPGRKTDVSDAEWLQRLHEYGLLRASFRPDAEIAALRDYLRQRERLLDYAAAHIQHMQKALTQMNLQLHHVVTDITGATGLRIIRAIVAGERDPAVLAALRDYRCKASEETVRQALVGNDREEHVFALAQALELYDTYQAKVAACDVRIEAALNRLQADCPVPATPLPAPRYQTQTHNALAFPAREALHRILGVDLTQIHGLGPYLALKLVGECGTSLAAWPSAKHFTSWLCYGTQQQDFRRQGALGQDPALEQSSCRPAAAGRGRSGPHRDGARCLLPPPVRARGQGQGGHCHRAQDRRAVLQHPATRYGLHRSRGLLLRGAIQAARAGQPPTQGEVARLRAAGHRPDPTCGGSFLGTGRSPWSWAWTLRIRRP